MAALFNFDGLLFILRWFHFFFGVMWIGHLYYFNFTHGAFMAEADASTKPGVVTKLLPRALYWFRFGALWTFITGLLYLGAKGHQAGSMAVYSGSWGMAILIGATFGTLMFLNVFLIIWPNQQVVIKSAEQVAKGGTALPEAAACAAKATLASRTNTLFSFPMLFFMGAASHLTFPVTPDSKIGLLTVIFAILIGGLQLNAIKGKVGPLATIKGFVISGIALTVLMYVIIGTVLSL